MSDIVERLRDVARLKGYGVHSEAADEILRLRSELEQAQQAALNAMEWHTIAADKSNVPKDGSWFAIGRDGEDWIEVGRYEPWTSYRYEDAGDGLFKRVADIVLNFTHDNFHRANRFLPLPPPPKEDGK